MEDAEDTEDMSRRGSLSAPRHILQSIRSFEIGFIGRRGLSRLSRLNQLVETTLIVCTNCGAKFLMGAIKSQASEVAGTRVIQGGPTGFYTGN